MPIPEKYFYTIGDVHKITGTKPHVLRYWESQFKLLRPARRYSGHRKFTPKDLDVIQKIRYLVVDRKFSLAGAKRELNRQITAKSAPPDTQEHSATPSPMLLQEIRKDVEECLAVFQPKSKQREFSRLE